MGFAVCCPGTRALVQLVPQSLGWREFRVSGFRALFWGLCGVQSFRVWVFGL